jgi:hypothetical protein
VTTRKQPDLRLVKPALQPENIFDDLDALRQVQAPLPTGVRRARLNETFARIPHDRAIELARHNIGGRAWIILIELDRLILKNRGRNPIRLPTWKLKMRRDVKRRALKQLEAAGVIKIGRPETGKAPLITHLWFPLRD